MRARKITPIRGTPVTLQAAADAFLSSPRCENPNTRRAYATVIDRLTAQLCPVRELADVDDSEISQALHELYGDGAPSTWNRNRAAAGSWLAWCRNVKRWPAPALPGDCERRAEHADHTHELPKGPVRRCLVRRHCARRDPGPWGRT